MKKKMDNALTADKIINVVLLINGEAIISQIEEVASEIGEPDCKLINPFVINSDLTLSPWIGNYTVQNIFMISSDKILTLSEPNQKLLEIYQKITK